MPLSKNQQQLVIAASVAAGTGMVAGVTGVVLYNRLTHKTQGYTQLAREVSSLRAELQALRAQLGGVAGIETTDQPLLLANDANLRKDLRRVASYASDDSLEYFDTVEDLEPLVGPSATLSQIYRQVDQLLANDQDEDREQSYDILKRHHAANSKDAGYLWRLARSTYLYGQTFLKVDENKRKQLCFEAKDYAFGAAALLPEDADVQKWCALTLGTVTDFLSLNDKIQSGYQFKLHIDKALELRLDDPILHHLRARWCFSVAELSWIERKVAATLFSQPPTSSFDEALRGFLEAERLQPSQWIENLLYVAKCYIQMKQTDLALPYLECASELIASTPDDKLAKEEASYILSKYK